MEKTIVSHRKYGKAFEREVSDIISNPYFQRLKNYTHHGKRRFDHSLLVAYNSYVIAKKAGLDARSTARGALLHDFFYDQSAEEKKKKRRHLKGLKKLTAMQGFTHPGMAHKNARKHFELNEKETDIITKHMFPMTSKMPRYRESWIVNGVDTGIALKEMAHTFYKHPIKCLTGKIK